MNNYELHLILNAHEYNNNNGLLTGYNHPSPLRFHKQKHKKTNFIKSHLQGKLKPDGKVNVGIKMYCSLNKIDIIALRRKNTLM